MEGEPAMVPDSEGRLDVRVFEQMITLLQDWTLASARKTNKRSGRNDLDAVSEVNQ